MNREKERERQSYKLILFTNIVLYNYQYRHTHIVFIFPFIIMYFLCKTCLSLSTTLARLDPCLFFCAARECTVVAMYACA